jgi:hypothetical protein
MDIFGFLCVAEGDAGDAARWQEALRVAEKLLPPLSDERDISYKALELLDSIVIQS